MVTVTNDSGETGSVRKHLGFPGLLSNANFLLPGHPLHLKIDLLVA